MLPPSPQSLQVLFADALTAKRAVAGLGKPLPPEEAPEQMGECGKRGGVGGVHAARCTPTPCAHQAALLHDR